MNMLLSPKEARQRLQIAAPTFNALWKSRLLGYYTHEDRIPLEGVDHYRTYGTQWQTEERFGQYGRRMMPEDLYQNLPQVPNVGVQPPDTQAHAQIWSDGVPENASDSDTGWIAHFYLVPNVFFFPNPTDMAMVGMPLLKLEAPKKVRGARLPCCLYPNPFGSLAMVSVTGINEGFNQLFETAYDVAGPVLDELSVKYDVPLPIVQTLIVGVPSGLMHVFFPAHSTAKKIERGEVLDPRCPYPELLDAVALYREGVSSNNPFHRFLAFWKVYEEAVYVRTGWRQEHRRRDIKVQEEIVPDVFAFGAKKEELAFTDIDEKALEEESFRGLSFHDARERLNRPYRVALAHAGDVKDGKPLTAASGKNLTDVSGQVPLVRYMARVVLENVRATLASSPSSSL